ncbi:hypothetical protein PMm318_A13860 [Pseudomonas moorei]
MNLRAPRGGQVPNIIVDDHREPARDEPESAAGCQVPIVIVDAHREPARSCKAMCELELYEQNGI